ncbi:hypothetical protein MVEN_00468000 [Mycena venus]|uniref:F-box domain-containing protein n=1 Tax=Mycena venus TaxID=2733690 RepID=A0A8H6YRK1_9AGAR|nr:hypothetical protein MVEN_00468000 [Mycena venus]
MPFHDLDEDVLASILAFCDIYAVVSFSRVNKSFRRLAQSKQLWLSLVLGLSARYFIPNLDAIRGYHTAQLISEARRLMCGPQTWSAKSVLPPTISFSKTFPGGSQARIVPGGRYFAICRESILQLCDVLTGRCIWSRSLAGTHGTYWEMEMLDDGDSAIFLFLQHSSVLNTQELSIVQVDLTTGHPDELFHFVLDAPKTSYRSPVLVGNLLAVGAYPWIMRRQTHILVIDWRRRVCLIFECSTASPRSQVAFVPGNIIFTTGTVEPPHDQLITVYTLSSIASRWRDLSELETNAYPADRALHIGPEDIRPAVVERLKHKNTVFRYPTNLRDVPEGLSVHMMLHPNPIRHHAYKLTIYASDAALSTEKLSFKDTLRQRFGRGSRRATGGMLFTYKLIVGSPPEHTLSWTKISVFPTSPQLMTPLSYAGHAVIYPSGSSNYTKVVNPRLWRPRFSWNHQTTRDAVVICSGSRRISLADTGAVLVIKPPQIEILYYI